MSDAFELNMQTAAWSELLARVFLYPSPELAEALATGQFAETLAELDAPKIGGEDLKSLAAELAGYVGQSADEVLKRLRVEHTRMFVGIDGPLISPYAGVWTALSRGAQPVLMVNREAMEIERFMRTRGVSRVDGRYDPVDHIGTMLEFSWYLALAETGAIAVEDDLVHRGDFALLWSSHLANWIPAWTEAVEAEARESLYAVGARLLRQFCDYTQTVEAV